MAKQIVSWNTTGSTLSIHPFSPANEELKPALEKFDLSILFPSVIWSELDEVEVHVLVYGTRQVLADAGSAVKTAEEKAEAAKERWQKLAVERNLGRSNAAIRLGELEKEFLKKMKVAFASGDVEAVQKLTAEYEKVKAEMENENN